jgi:FHS family L-fucose permease-like MFS transporter
MIALLLTSFFMSLMFPTIFAQGIRGLGETAKLGGSLIVMAIIGGAVLTPVMGLLSIHFGGLAAAYIVPALAYVLIAVYSFADMQPVKSDPSALTAREA